MLDQANRLRQLVEGVRAASLRTSLGMAPPRLLAVTGGKGGVGATTVAVNLAVALARDGRRTVLVDADLDGADAGALCGLGDSPSVADVLAGRLTVHEALVRGPAGLQVLPGTWAPGRLTDCSAAAQLRLLDQLAGLGPHAEYVVLDVGNGQNHVVRRFWQAADRVLLVTTPDAVSVMDSYATIKSLGADLPGRRRILSLVNMAPDAEMAAGVHQRLARACHRLLRMELGCAGQVPLDPQVAASARGPRPMLIEAPACAAARHVEHLAEALCANSPTTPQIAKNDLTGRPPQADLKVDCR